MKTVVSEKGQVTIPKRLRDQLGLKTGTVLDFMSENGKLIAVKKIEQDPIEKWRGRGKLPFGNDPMEYLKAIRG
jgi:antitoxin PrlF